MIIMDPTQDARWDRALPQSATFFHSTAWARILNQTYGHTPLYLAVATSNQLTPVLPVVEINSRITGKRGVSLPFSDSCPKLETETVTDGLAFDTIIAEGRRRGWRSYESRDGNITSPTAFPSRTGYLHHLPLQPDSDKLFARCTSAVRRAVRKAERAGLRVNIRQDFEAVRIFYALHVRTRRRFGLPPQPLAFFRNLHKEVISAGAGFVALAEHACRAIAGGVFLLQGRNAIYKFGASDESHQLLRGNNCVFWSSIRWLAANGFERLDLGRTAPKHHGLRRFKQSWGTVETSIPYTKYDLRCECFVTESERTAGWHTHLFRRLPHCLNRFLGGALYAHLD